MFQAINYMTYRFFGLSVVGPYLVSLLPRLTMLVLSFSVDYCVYKICVLYKHSYNRCLTTLASSYVMLVYSTRTLTNTLEMVKMDFNYSFAHPSNFIFHPPVFDDLADILGGALHQANVRDRIPPFHAEGGARQGRNHEGKGTG